MLPLSIRTQKDPFAPCQSFCFSSSLNQSQNFSHTVLQPGSFECSSCRFVEIAFDLQKLHNMGYCHIHIRISNLILGGSKGMIIDFDRAS